MSSLYESMWPAFFAEVSEQLDELEILLVSVDAAGRDINHTFRLFHTIKSSAAMMEFSAMEQLAHVAEDILDLVRKSKASLDENMCELISMIASRLKHQLQQADRTQARPDPDVALHERATQFLGNLMEQKGENTGNPSDGDRDTVQDSADMKAFQLFRQSASTTIPALADWLLGNSKVPPRSFASLIQNAKKVNLPAIALLAERVRSEAIPERWWTFADLLHRLNTLRTMSDSDFGVPALAKSLSATLAGEIRLRSDELQAIIPVPSEAGLTRAAVLLAEQAALCWLVDYRALATLIRFLRQIILDALRGKLVLDGPMWELVLLALYLTSEVDPEQPEDAGFADVCGRTMTSLQSQVRAAIENEENQAICSALIQEYDLPYSLIASLHHGSLQDLLDSCRQELPLFDIEVDMDGPDVQRDGFLKVIEEHGRLISNRTVFTSDRPGDRDAEGTRLSIIASCNGNPEAMRSKLLTFHSDRFHLSVTEIPYRRSQQGDVAEVHAESEPDQPAAERAAEVPGITAISSDTVRVSSDGLDRFVTRIGELVLLRNRIDHILRSDDTEKLTSQLEALSRKIARRESFNDEGLLDLSLQLDSLLGQLDRLRDTDDELQQSLGQLQNDALALRVVPIDMVFRRMPVLVKQLSRQLGKPVELHVSGADTRIDKSMVDVLSEPLIHMIRNALDHGIETPEERQLVGKSTTAHLSLRASNQGGTLSIELSDDGRGLDEQRILEKALAKGIVKAEQAATLGLSEIQRLIFEPGFSTAASVTETSGRGVGMDVVKTRIEQLGGTVSVRSTPKRGCQITLTMPVSAAIQGIVLFQHHGCTYGLPERNLAEIISVDQTGIQAIQGQMAILHRGHTLPLYTLSHLFRQSGDNSSRPAHFPVLLISDGHRRIGLIVDEIQGRQEIFVRDCHPDIAQLPGVAGASILGNGQPVLILDTTDLIDLAAQQAQSLDALLEAS
jgi:chemotaxis protein histidine kinase CheA